MTIYASFLMFEYHLNTLPQALVKAQPSSVNAAELETCSYIIEWLYFLVSLGERCWCRCLGNTAVVHHLTSGMSSQVGSSLGDSDGDGDGDSDNAAATTKRVVTATETATVAVMVTATATAAVTVSETAQQQLVAMEMRSAKFAIVLQERAGSRGTL
ncbi:MAG: hypothetical protein DMG78_26675 [Acidobacteria bacterium]|nr:MAG: hypothetical protein DMG78_26675 [Acidobacteriota bacterium]